MHVFPRHEVNEKGLNVKLIATPLSDEQMRALGFTDYREGWWYFCKGLYKMVGNRKKPSDISFNLSIRKQADNDGVYPLDIDVLDEDFLQPYDYQYLITKPNCPDFAKSVFEQVEELMAFFTDAGVLHGHMKGEYI